MGKSLINEIVTVDVGASTGISSGTGVYCTAVCIPSSFAASMVRYVGFATTTQRTSYPFLGVYDALTGERLAYSNTTIQYDKVGGIYPFVYTLSVPVNNTRSYADHPGLIFAFFNVNPPAEYVSIGVASMTLVKGATLNSAMSCAYSNLHDVNLPYVFTSETPDYNSRFVAFESPGSYNVWGVKDNGYNYNYLDINAGSTLAAFGTYANPEEGVILQANGGAVAVEQKSAAVAWRELQTKTMRNLYTSDGWVELLRFNLPDTWVWTKDCSIVPAEEKGKYYYTLCGRVLDGKLEWQFGNLVVGKYTASPITPGGDVPDLDMEYVLDEEGNIHIVYKDPNTGVIVDNSSVENSTSGSDSSDSGGAYTLIDRLSVLANMETDADGGCIKPLVRWAGKEASEKLMLAANGLLRASCEPVYIGMFNTTSSYSATGTVRITPTPTPGSDEVNPYCESGECQSESNTVSIMAREVSPVWFLFASIRDGLLHLVALEHTIAGADAYELYGTPPKFGCRYLRGMPPSNYRRFNTWKYTNFVTPPDEYVTYYPEPDPADEFAHPGGYYLNHLVTGDVDDSKYPVSADHMAEKCYNTPVKAWMLAHSKIDTTAKYVASINLAVFGSDNSVTVLDNSSKLNTAYIDNTQYNEYRWQWTGSTYAYVRNESSRYIASIEDSRYRGQTVSTIAYLPVGYRYGRDTAGYVNQALELVAAGKCIKFNNLVDTVAGSDALYIDANALVIPGTEPTSTADVFKYMDNVNAVLEDRATKIAVPSGAVLAYDACRLGEYDLQSIVPVSNDLGNGNVVITAASANAFRDAYEGCTLSGSWIGKRKISEFTLGLGTNDNSTFYSEARRSSLTGDLVIQYKFCLGISSEVPCSISSFSNVILDDAVMYVINKETTLSNLTVYSGDSGMLALEDIGTGGVTIGKLRVNGNVAMANNNGATVNIGGVIGKGSVYIQSLPTATAGVDVSDLPLIHTGNSAGVITYIMSSTQGFLGDIYYSNSNAKLVSADEEGVVDVPVSTFYISSGCSLTGSKISSYRVKAGHNSGVAGTSKLSAVAAELDGTFTNSGIVEIASNVYVNNKLINSGVLTADEIHVRGPIEDSGTLNIEALVIAADVCKEHAGVFTKCAENVELVNVATGETKVVTEADDFRFILKCDASSSTVIGQEKLIYESTEMDLYYHLVGASGVKEYLFDNKDTTDLSDTPYKQDETVYAIDPTLNRSYKAIETWQGFVPGAAIPGTYLEEYNGEDTLDLDALYGGIECSCCTELPPEDCCGMPEDDSEHPEDEFDDIWNGQHGDISTSSLSDEGEEGEDDSLDTEGEEEEEEEEEDCQCGGGGFDIGGGGGENPESKRCDPKSAKVRHHVYKYISNDPNISISTFNDTNATAIPSSLAKGHDIYLNNVKVTSLLNCESTMTATAVPDMSASYSAPGGLTSVLGYTLSLSGNPLTCDVYYAGSYNGNPPRKGTATAKVVQNDIEFTATAKFKGVRVGAKTRLKVNSSSGLVAQETSAAKLMQRPKGEDCYYIQVHVIKLTTTKSLQQAVAQEIVSKGFIKAEFKSDTKVTIEHVQRDTSAPALPAGNPTIEVTCSNATLKPSYTGYGALPFAISSVALSSTKPIPAAGCSITASVAGVDEEHQKWDYVDAGGTKVSAVPSVPQGAMATYTTTLKI